VNQTPTIRRDRDESALRVQNPPFAIWCGRRWSREVILSASPNAPHKRPRSEGRFNHLRLPLSYYTFEALFLLRRFLALFYLVSCTLNGLRSGVAVYRYGPDHWHVMFHVRLQIRFDESIHTIEASRRANRTRYRETVPRVSLPGLVSFPSFPSAGLFRPPWGRPAGPLRAPSPGRVPFTQLVYASRTLIQRPNPAN